MKRFAGPIVIPRAASAVEDYEWLGPDIVGRIHQGWQESLNESFGVISCEFVERFTAGAKQPIHKIARTDTNKNGSVSKAPPYAVLTCKFP